MKKTIAITILAALTLAAATARVSRASLAAMEKSLDQKVLSLWPDNPFALLGTTRGVYVEGMGAVFTAEINLATGPTIMPGLGVSKEAIARHRETKLKRLPQIKQELKKILMSTAASLDGVSPEEQVVLAVFLYRYHWEDSAGMPAQLQMQAQKKQLVQAMQSNGANLDSIIRMQEQ